MAATGAAVLLFVVIFFGFLNVRRNISTDENQTDIELRHIYNLEQPKLAHTTKLLLSRISLIVGVGSGGLLCYSLLA